jgi:Ca-activated chloride channel family protein
MPVVFTALCALFGSAMAASPPGFDDPILYPPEVYEGDPVVGGELRVDGADSAGMQGALVLDHTSVVAEVSAGLSRVTMTQWFINPYDAPISATYLLPLPAGAAVDRMEMVCGDRHVEGMVLEREVARDLYDEAKAEGRKAALLEEERENLFTQSVSNLCPGEEVELTIQWVEQVRYEDATYSWEMPLTVGPRFSPPWVEDAARLETPYDQDGQKVDITVAIEEGTPVGGLWSDSHDIVVDDEGPWGAEVSLEEEETIPNQDFHLSWTLDGRTPVASVVTTRPDPDEPGYLALTIEPPELGEGLVNRPRELVFLLDESCSMTGEPFDTSKRAVLRALKGMRPTDTFNLVEFSGSTSTLFETSQPYTEVTLAKAERWLEGFSGGGTYMEQGLTTALDLPARPDALRLVLLLTDGFVGDDDQIARLVREHLGNSRLFSLGVSASPNHALLENLATAGRGAVIYHHPGASIDAAVNTFQARIAHAAMSDVTIDWGGLTVSEQYPEVIPDIWAGQPVRVVARYTPHDDEPVTVTVRGIVGTRPFVMRLPVEAAPEDASHEAVATLWARRKVQEFTLNAKGWSKARVRDAIVDVALDYGLVTRYTSLVAIDDELSSCGPAGVTLRVPHRAPVDMAASGGGLGYGSGSWGGGSAYGIGGYGYVGARYASRSTGAIGFVGGDPIVLGAMDNSLVDDVIKRGKNPIRYCYQKELQKDPTLAGTIHLKFVLAESGAVTASQVVSSSLTNPAVGECVAQLVSTWTFPPGHGVRVVNYPFVFSLAAAAPAPKE